MNKLHSIIEEGNKICSFRSFLEWMITLWRVGGQLKVPMTDVFLSLLHSTLSSDVKSEKKFPVAIFIHRVLAV